MLSQLDFVRINECFKEPCLNDGQCVPLDNGFVCHCLPGFWGKDTKKDTSNYADFPHFVLSMNTEYRDCEQPLGEIGNRHVNSESFLS